LNQRGEISFRTILIFIGMLFIGGIYFRNIYPGLVAAGVGQVIFYQLIGAGFFLIGVYALIKKPANDPNVQGF
jgi:hypothetical protein